jgi:uncharacterized membrane protein YGL010W
LLESLTQFAAPNPAADHTKLDRPKRTAPPRNYPSKPPFFSSGVAVNWALVALLGYAAFYAALDPLAGLSWSLAVGLPLYVTATAFQKTAANAAWWAAGVQVVSWYMQIHPGHAVFEGRKPALLDSLLQVGEAGRPALWRSVVCADCVHWCFDQQGPRLYAYCRPPDLTIHSAARRNQPEQAVLLAPLFVWFELLFLLGYRPQLHAQLTKRVKTEIAAWKRRQKKA